MPSSGLAAALAAARGPTGPTGAPGVGVPLGPLGPRGPVNATPPPFTLLATAEAPTGAPTGTFTFPAADGVLSTGTYVVLSQWTRISATANNHPFLEYSFDGGVGFTGAAANTRQSGVHNYQWNAASVSNQNATNAVRLGLILDVNNQKVLNRTTFAIFPDQVVTYGTAHRFPSNAFNALQGSTTTLVLTPPTLVTAVRITFTGTLVGRVWLYRVHP